MVSMIWWMKISPNSNSSPWPCPPPALPACSSSTIRWWPSAAFFFSAWLCCHRRMKGFGKSMNGTESAVYFMSVCASSTEPSQRGKLSCWPIAMQIKELMMFGALSIGCVHLYKIMTSIQPKKHNMKTIMGMHSKMKSVRFLSYRALLQRSNNPTIICKTPKSTDNFIFKEFTYNNSFEAPCQAQSRPNGYGPGPPPFLTS
mmetsp:Transcript_40526/g.93808  ORF Transcript_40526/g.93808 Transcript_40526/m.93808 type:complete len:201 (-) Transcript_40526:1043-1645(-)